MDAKIIKGMLMSLVLIKKTINVRSTCSVSFYVVKELAMREAYEHQLDEWR
jgi:hypothetical protein